MTATIEVAPGISLTLEHTTNLLRMMITTATGIQAVVLDKETTEFVRGMLDGALSDMRADSSDPEQPDGETPTTDPDPDSEFNPPSGAAFATSAPQASHPAPEQGEEKRKAIPDLVIETAEDNDTKLSACTNPLNVMLSMGDGRYRQHQALNKFQAAQLRDALSAFVGEENTEREAVPNAKVTVGHGHAGSIAIGIARFEHPMHQPTLYLDPNRATRLRDGLTTVLVQGGYEERASRR